MTLCWVANWRVQQLTNCWVVNTPQTALWACRGCQKVLGRGCAKGIVPVVEDGLQCHPLPGVVQPQLPLALMDMELTVRVMGEVFVGDCYQWGHLMESSFLHSQEQIPWGWKNCDHWQRQQGLFQVCRASLHQGDWSCILHWYHPIYCKSVWFMSPIGMHPYIIHMLFYQSRKSLCLLDSSFFFVPTVDYKNCMGDGINCTKSAGVSIILNPNWQGIAHVNQLPIKLTLKPPLHSFHEYLRCRDLASLWVTWSHRW